MVTCEAGWERSGESGEYRCTTKEGWIKEDSVKVGGHRGLNDYAQCSIERRLARSAYIGILAQGRGCSVRCMKPMNDGHICVHIATL